MESRLATPRPHAMAESVPVSITRQALGQLADQLTCGICFESYSNPKLLNCAHVFCEGCIQRMVMKDRSGRRLTVCPNCRKETPLGKGGVTSLQNAFYISNLTEIQDTLEQVNKTELLPCPMHGDKELEFYCHTCDTMICSLCALRSHKGHQFNLGGEELGESEHDVAVLEPVNAKLVQVKPVIEQIGMCGELVLKQRSALVAEVDTVVKRVMDELMERKADLMHQIYQATEDKLLDISAAKQRVVDVREQLKHCLVLWEREAKDQDLENKLAATVSDIEIGELELPGVLDISISTTVPDNLIQSVKKLGEADPGHPKSYAACSGLSKAVVGEKATVTLYTIDDYGKLCTKPVDSIFCELEPLAFVTNTAYGGIVVDTSINPLAANTMRDTCSVTHVKGNEYQVDYTPSTRGQHHLHIELEGKPITGSPFTVLVKPSLQQLGSPVHIFNIKAPYGVAIDRKGHIIVARVGSNDLAVVNQDGKIIKTIGKMGSGNGEFVRPYGLTIDGDGNMLVVDSGNSRIQKFTCSGAFVASVGKKGGGPLEFDSPHGISYNSRNGRVYVADTNNSRIQVLNSNLSFSSFIGSKGSKEGELMHPWAMAFDSEGHCYVADGTNKRIQVFTASGSFLYDIGRIGSKAEALEFPSDLTIDQDDVIYVTDLKAHKVMVYSHNGTFLATIGEGLGDKPGQLNLPHAITLDRDGIVYVSDLKNSRIQCF